MGGEPGSAAASTRWSEPDLAAARERGVGGCGLFEFHHGGAGGKEGVVLGYANLTPDTIRWGASVLVDLLR